MDILPNFDGRIGSEKVCRLKKTLFALKWSPRTWFGSSKLSYKWDTLFIKHTKKGKVTILLVHVDNMMVIGNDETEMRVLKIV